jgi:teichuronic acid biosynthesis glycosyltransferase TuaC
MKVLIVCSGNVENFSFELHQAFVFEQIEKVKQIYNVDYEVFSIRGKGLIGYLKNILSLRKKISQSKPDLIHAHYGLSGLLSVFQFRKPVVVTFHNGEILSRTANILSSLVTLRSKFDIYVARHIRKQMYFKKSKNYSIIPCGIDLQTMKIFNTKDNGFSHIIDPNKKNILFGGSFNNERKNYALAKEAINLLTRYDVNLIELKGFARNEVNQLLNMCDLALLPSKSEGSPQFIKEAMACNCPIVATDVGDIKEVIGGTDGCFITSFDPADAAEKIKLALDFNRRTNGREKIQHFDNDLIARKIFNIYQEVIG